MVEPDVDLHISRYDKLVSPESMGIRCNEHLLCCVCPLHLHDFYEMELAIDAPLPQKINGVPYNAGAGDFVLMNLENTQFIKPEGPVRLLTLSISPTEADPAIIRLFSGVRFPLVGHLEPEALAKVRKIGADLSFAVQNKVPYRRERVAALTVLLLTELLAVGRTQKGGAEEPHAQHYIRSALAFLNAHYAEPLTLADLANEIHITPCYLSDLFSRLVGCGFVTYLTNLRLKKARHLLMETDAPMTEIARRCGFGTPANFTRAHKRLFGVSPSACRRESIAN